MSGLKITATAALAVLALAATAATADDRDYHRYEERYHHDRYDDEAYYDEDEHAHPLTGHRIARDYLTGDYYEYQGTPVRDPRVGEQEGWRDGVIRTPPRSYWRRCGCSRLWYGGRWHSRPKLYDYDAYDYSYRHRLDRRTSYEYRWPRRNW